MTPTPRATIPATGVLGGAVSAFAGAPWWAAVTCIALGCALNGLHAVFPQDSSDRLTWWQDRRRHRERRRRHRTAPGQSNRSP